VSKFLSNEVKKHIDSDTSSVRDTFSDQEFVYFVVRVEPEPEDTIFGEPVNPFATTSGSTESLYRLKCSVLSRSSVSKYNEAGFSDKDSLRFDISNPPKEIAETITTGSLFMYRGEYFRVTSLSERGMVSTNRVIAFVEEVT